MSTTTSDVLRKILKFSPFECVVASIGELYFYCYMINYQDFSYNGSKITFSFSEKCVMVNATKMSKPFGKVPAKWLELPSTKEFIATLSNIRKSDISQLVITKQGSGVSGGGTWMHKDVAIEFARWLSPIFSIWCNDRIMELLTKGRTELTNFNMPAPTDDVVKDDSITTDAMRVHDKDYSFSEVGRLIKWNGKPMQRRLFVAYLHEHGFLTYAPGCADYPTEMAIALGLLCVIDRCKRGGQKKLIKPRVRVTMDGANYFINVLSHGLRGVIKAQ